MTFGEYVDKVANTVFPEGRAENLTARHTLIVTDALIDLQRKVKCLRTGNCEYTAAEACDDVCSASVFAAPPGMIRSVTIAQATSVCKFFRPEKIASWQFDVLVRENSACIVAAYAEVDAATDPAPPARLTPPCSSESLVRPVLPAAERCSGYYTHDQDSIRIFPPLVEGEVAVVQWSGIKQSWEEHELMAPHYTMRDVMHAAELWLESDSQRLEAKDIRASASALVLYRDEVAKLIYTCRQNTWPVYDLQIPTSISARPVATQLILWGKLSNPNATLAEVSALPSTASTNRFVVLDYPGAPDAKYAYIALPGDFGVGLNPEGFVLADSVPLSTIPMGNPDVDGAPFGSQTLNDYWFEPMTLYGKPYRLFRTAIAYVADLSIRIQ